MKLLRVISNLLRFDRTNWTALALCVFAAAIFWVFNALNKPYSTTLSLPLKVEFDEQRFATKEQIPPRLPVNVTGIGWELLRKTLGQKTTPITLSLERPQEVRRIPGASLAPQIASQLGGLQLNYVVLDTLRLSIESRVTRNLKLTADASRVSFRNGVGRTSPVVVLPDSVTLQGPASYVLTLPDSLIIQVPPRRVTATYRESLEVLIAHSEFILRDPPVAEVMFEVGPMVDWDCLIPLGLSRTSRLIADRDSVSLTLRIPRKDQERVPADAASISVSFSEPVWSTGDTAWIQPRIVGLPPYASLVRIDSIRLRKKLAR